jgi:hypothetical protein
MSKQSKSVQDIVLTETQRVLQELFGDQFLGNTGDLESQRQKDLEKSIRDRGVIKKSDSKKEKITQDKRKDEAEKEEDKELEDLLGDEQDDEGEEKKSSEESDSNEKSKDDEKKQPSGKERTKGKWTADSPKLADPPKDVLADPSFNDIKVAMDLFRGGKSTNDPKVKKYLQSYVGKLSTDEKQAMYAFFTATAQILSGKAKGKEAIEPSDIGVRMTSANGDKEPAERKIDPKKIVPPSQIPSGTSTPIVVGESADKTLIKRILSSNR